MIPTTDKTMRIALVGKTGAGKSSLANTITDATFYEVDNSPNSGTVKCKSKTWNVHGHNIQVVDTPGLFDTDPSSTELSREILKCVTECAPGPHAFLIVLKIEKYTVQEIAVVNMILKYFTEKALKFTTVVFTQGDNLQEGMKIEEWVKMNPSLDDLVQKCGGRCRVFDNKYWKNSEDEYRNNQYQIAELLKTINKTVEDNGTYYTNALLKKTGEQIEQEITRLKATAEGDQSDEILYQTAKRNILERLWSGIKGNPAGVIIGALLGVGVMVPLVAFALQCAVTSAVISVTSAVVGAAAGGGMQQAVKKIKHRPANVTPGEAEQPQVEREEEQGEEVLLRTAAEEKMKEWQREYQGYKKFQ